MAPQNKILTMSHCRENAANGLAMYQRAGERNCRLRVVVLTCAKIGYDSLSRRMQDLQISIQYWCKKAAFLAEPDTIPYRVSIQAS